MLPNPYTPSGMPRVYVGRERERRRLRDRLASVAAYGEMMGPLTIVTGPRGVGKTSLLRETQAQAGQDGFVTVWVTGVKFRPFLGDLIGATNRALARAEVLAPDQRKRRHLEEIGLEAGIGVAKVSAKLAREPEPEPTGLPAATVVPVEDFFREAAGLVRGRGGAGLLVIIDELHEPLESHRERDYLPDPQARLETAILLNAIQNMDAEREHYPVGFLGAGLPHTKALLTRAATFGERTPEIVLGELDEDTARAVLTEPAGQLEVTWAPDALQSALARADGYPQALQVIGSATWEAAQPAPGHVLSAADLHRGGADIDADLASMFEARWSVATAAERAVLIAMASIGDERVKRSEVASRLGVSTYALSNQRMALINKGIIETAGHGYLRFTIPGFAEYVRSQFDDTDPLPEHLALGEGDSNPGPPTRYL